MENRCSNIEKVVQPDPSYAHLSAFNEGWLCVSSVLVPLNSIFSESKHESITFPLRSSSFLLKPICKFCGNSNSLNYFVVSNNLFLVENIVRLSYPSYFSEHTILISYCYKYFWEKYAFS